MKTVKEPTEKACEAFESAAAIVLAMAADEQRVPDVRREMTRAGLIAAYVVDFARSPAETGA